MCWRSAGLLTLQTAPFSLLASSAFGEALLFLAMNSPIRITDRRIALVRELARTEIRRELGLEQEQHVSQRLLARERESVLTELRRAAEFGSTVAIQRLRTGTAVPHASAGPQHERQPHRRKLIPEVA
ncbi:MAG TPA: hypothetical protein VGG22_03005 [Candidatus Baltobacteraceae bacterium]